MKLTARTVPYSSIVGGGVQLMNEQGHAAFQIALVGTTKGITFETTKAIADRLVELINEHGLEVPKP